MRGVMWGISALGSVCLALAPVHLPRTTMALSVAQSRSALRTSAPVRGLRPLGGSRLVVKAMAEKKVARPAPPAPMDQAAA